MKFNINHEICNKCSNPKTLISGPHSLTCDLVGNFIECPSDCKGTGSCSPQPKKYICLKCDGMIKNYQDHKIDPNCYMCNKENYNSNLCPYHANLNKFCGKEIKIKELLRKSEAYISLIRHRCHLNWGKGIPELREMDELIGDLREELGY
jgi:hypothetical protein